ncbi:hypothetical protein B484DRAFT_447888 [Ochromonadaceae sp. CCMP2298]|nr:hypothetical protein B484DRAFT_447888 [Ochromonadaceae sp. CCMP2298]
MSGSMDGCAEMGSSYASIRMGGAGTIPGSALHESAKVQSVKVQHLSEMLDTWKMQHLEAGTVFGGHSDKGLIQSFAHVSHSHAKQLKEQHSHRDTELDETTGEEMEVQFAVGALLLVVVLGVVIVAVVAVAVASTAVLQRSRERVSQYSAHSSNPTLYGNATFLP